MRSLNQNNLMMTLLFKILFIYYYYYFNTLQNIDVISILVGDKREILREMIDDLRACCH